MCDGCDYPRPPGGRDAVIAALGRMTDHPALPDGVSIGAATAGDVAELLALWAAAAENDSRPADTAQAVLALLQRYPEACLVARHSGASWARSSRAGTGGAPTCTGSRSIPPWRRQGIGRALLEAGAARLRALGAARLDAMVLEGNQLGQALWQGSGYAPQPEWRRWVKPSS